MVILKKYLLKKSVNAEPLQLTLNLYTTTTTLRGNRSSMIEYLCFVRSKIYLGYLIDYITYFVCLFIELN